MDRMIEPRLSGPAGGGRMKLDVGQRKYVFVNVKAMVSSFALRFRASFQTCEVLDRKSVV